MAAEVLVTIRMPASLVKALKARTGQDHYNDLSEQIRSIVRKGCLSYAGPVPQGLESLKAQLKEELFKEREDERARKLIESIQEIIGGGGR